MLLYRRDLKQRARHLRNHMTESERLLWSRLRKKQILGVQFYRQKPMGDYIVDFYAPKVKLVIEVDGSQHLEEDHIERDKRRDAALIVQGLEILRVNNLEVLQELDAVMEVILEKMLGRLKSPLSPPLGKGER
ncbi:MAG: hypothetical protein A3B79_00430 [Deltaproteobacteria bacterium RIFCSPHIGHO2_02_FULL_50_15]|nr:MAG: hypothetical protein A3B79_00430 [Deltaproteobacteria bacterium RIFCSPHIGHO2_02_FULL_50_15]